jgi:hypothetical protein
VVTAIVIESLGLKEKTGPEAVFADPPLPIGTSSYFFVGRMLIDEQLGMFAP